MAGEPYLPEEDAWLSSEGEKYSSATIAEHYPTHFPRRSTVSLMRRRQLVLERMGDDQGQRGIDRLGRIADLLERSNINPEDIGRVERIRLNEWQGMYKDENAEAQIVDMTGASVILSPTWDDGPEWPVVQPGPSIIIRPRKPKAIEVRREMRVAVVLPDTQIGYYRDLTGDFHSTHDEAAIDVALQVLDVVSPDQVILLGDNLDFPELGKYRKEPAFVQTTQQTVDRATLFLAAIRARIPESATIEWLEGNHDIRLPNHIKDNAIAAFGLKKGNAPDSWPVLSVPNLCRFDEIGVTYAPGYPHNVVWLSDRLQCIHGNKARKGPSVQVYLNDERVSTVCGHIHRREWMEKTRRTRYGTRTIMAASPGCLCRVDGVVPSTNSGTDVEGQPIRSFEDWQQGMAVIHYTPDDGPFYYEQVPIHHGSTFWHGRRFDASCDLEGKPLDVQAA